MRRIPRNLIALLIAPIIALSASPALAQHSYSVRIDDGEVYVNGERVPEDDLPESLMTDGLQAQYVFSGDVAPIIRVGNGFFVLEDGRLREAEPHEREEVSVIFRDRMRSALRSPMGVRGEAVAAAAAEHAALARAAEQAAFDGFPESSQALSARAPHIAFVQGKAAELQKRAEVLQELQQEALTQGDTERIEALERAARELSVHAEETARAARAMPSMQVQGYLSTIREHNQALFDRLIDERSMEHETLELAAEIRREQDEGLREQKVDRLRTRLHEIFDLKQDNRRREVEELEQRLDELQENLAERERRRDEIVERRLRELLHESESLNW